MDTQGPSLVSPTPTSALIQRLVLQSLCNESKLFSDSCRSILHSTVTDSSDIKKYDRANLTRRAYEIDGRKYLTLNVQSEPNPPSEERPFKFGSPHLCYKRPQWFSERYPFMAYCLADPKWEGPILRRLNSPRYLFPVSSFKYGYRLHPFQQRLWLQLEVLLTNVYQYHLRRTAMVFAHTFAIQKFSPPSHWGYLANYPNEREAQQAAYNSRNAFVPLMALCTYALSGETQFHPLEEKKWIKYHVEDLGINIEWANQLAESEIFSPSAPRIGMYVDNDKLPHNIFVRLMALNAPLFVRIRLSPAAAYNIHPILDVSKKEIQDTERRITLELTQEREDQADRNPRNHAITTGFPSTTKFQRIFPLETGSRQRYFETFDKFFERDDLTRERSIAIEDNRHRQSRLQRELNAASVDFPSSGARVFEWQEKKGHLIRCFISRNLVDTVWGDYARSQKRYNSIRNEWDLCKLLDPTAQPDESAYDEGFDNDDDDDDFPVFVPIDTPARTVDSVQSAPTLADAAQKDILDIYDTSEPSQEGAATLELWGLLHLLYLRYGFTNDDTAATQPAQLDFSKTTAILTEVNDQTVGNQHTINAICCFIQGFIDGKETVPHLHDIHSNNLRRFLSGCNKHFYFKNHKDFYTVTSADTPDYILYTPPFPSLLVQLLRDSEATNLAKAALSFASKSIPFDWSLASGGPFRPAFLLSTSEKAFGLGFRPPGFQATRVDYKAYRDQRKRLLSDVAIVREALKFGGIIWRLAVEAYCEEHGGTINFEEILEAPLEQISLSERDLGIIVGLYKVWSRKY